MSEQEIRVGQVWRRKKTSKLIRITRGDPWGWDHWLWEGHNYEARGATAGAYIRRDYELVDDGTLIEYLTKLRDEYQADSFTAQAEHARWQERAEAAEAAQESLEGDANDLRIRLARMQEALHIWRGRAEAAEARAAILAAYGEKGREH